MARSVSSSEKLAQRLGIEHTTIVDGSGKHVSANRITCMRCGYIDHVVANVRSHSLPTQMVVKKMQQRGWTITSNWAECKKCIDLSRVRDPLRAYVPKPQPPAVEWTGRDAPMEMSPPEPIKEITVSEPVRLEALAEIRQPDRATKRAILEAIQGSWDDSKSRYLGNASDEVIARDLKVPRKWVSDIRIDIFGENGGNQDIDDLKRDLDKKIIEIGKLADQGMKLAATFEAVGSELKDMRRRLERIEGQVLPRR